MRRIYRYEAKKLAWFFYSRLNANPNNINPLRRYTTQGGYVTGPLLVLLLVYC